jgi:branched-chain amino acid transport system permease protein
VSRNGAYRFAVAAAAVVLVVFPLVATTFLTVQIGFQSLFLATAALSLIFLAQYGGMVSLAQFAFYGVSGYTLAIVTVTYGLPWYLGVLGGLTMSALVAFAFGLVSVRTQGIYFLMITLAMAMLLYFYAEQDRVFTNGHTGINGVLPPGGPVAAHPVAYYYLALAVSALVYAALRYVVRTPFGLALQGIRDDPQRMRSLGYDVERHRVAAFALAGLVAGIGGVLGVWYNGAISPGTIDLTRTINLLVIAVVGGLTYFEGAFVGAVFFTLITNFASSFTNRFNTVIGLAFLLIAVFSPQGLLGLVLRLRPLGGRRGPKPVLPGVPETPAVTPAPLPHPIDSH